MCESGKGDIRSAVHSARKKALRTGITEAGHYAPHRIKINIFSAIHTSAVYSRLTNLAVCTEIAREIPRAIFSDLTGGAYVSSSDDQIRVRFLRGYLAYGGFGGEALRMRSIYSGRHLIVARCSSSFFFLRKGFSVFLFPTLSLPLRTGRDEELPFGIAPRLWRH